MRSDSLFKSAEADLVAATLTIINVHLLPGNLGVDTAVRYVVLASAHRSVSLVMVSGPPGALSSTPPRTLSLYVTPA